MDYSNKPVYPNSKTARHLLNKSPDQRREGHKQTDATEPTPCAPLDKIVGSGDSPKRIGKHDDDYTEELEGLAKELIVSMENMLSLVDPKRTPVCGNIGAANQAALLIDQYHQLQQNWSND